MMSVIEQSATILIENYILRKGVEEVKSTKTAHGVTVCDNGKVEKGPYVICDLRETPVVKNDDGVWVLKNLLYEVK